MVRGRFQRASYCDCVSSHGAEATNPNWRASATALLLELMTSTSFPKGINPVELLDLVWRIRAGDVTEQHLIRQGKGWIHIPGQGHEALAALALALEPHDLLFLYYRDRALMQARGVSSRQMASEYFATARSSTGWQSHARARNLSRARDFSACNTYRQPVPSSSRRCVGCETKRTG